METSELCRFSNSFSLTVVCCLYLSTYMFHFFPQALDLNSIKTHHWLIQDCSAVTGDNLLNGMDWVVNDIASRIFTMD